MKILVTGMGGQLGFELQRSLAPIGEVVAVGHNECDFANPDALRALLRSVQPDVIVNPAAYTAVDRAESDAGRAFAINGEAPRIIGEEASRLRARVIHYSTDYVFDGRKEGFYTEADRPDPLNIYGHSKLAGEKALEATGARCVVLRTSWVVGAHGGNFVKSILRLAAAREELDVVADQYGAPTSASLIADVTAHMLRELSRDCAGGSPFEIYHIAAGGETTWHEYAKFVVETALQAGLPLTLKPHRIRPISSSDYQTAALRPGNSRLSTDRLRARFGVVLPDWRAGVGHVLKQIV